MERDARKLAGQAAARGSNTSIYRLTLLKPECDTQGCQARVRISSAKDPKSDPKRTQRPQSEAAAPAQVTISSQENADTLSGRSASSGGAC